MKIRVRSFARSKFKVFLWCHLNCTKMNLESQRKKNICPSLEICTKCDKISVKLSVYSLLRLDLLLLLLFCTLLEIWTKYDKMLRTCQNVCVHRLRKVRGTLFLWCSNISLCWKHFSLSLLILLLGQ